MKPSLFPAGVVFVRAAPAWADERLHPLEAAAAGRMSPDRRREFALGRACARHALAKLGLRDAPVLRGSEREPTWPEGVIGSLTHTDGYCAAAVARRGALLALGLDAESTTISARAARRVLDADERAKLAALPAAPAGRDFATLAFSAKESVFKAIYPLTGVRLVFRDVQIEIDPDSGSFRVALIGERRALLPRGARIEGRYAFTRACVVTSIVILYATGSK